jgi:hypothetical protein
MAPEILCDFINVTPSKYTDYHSLAVFLFQLWCWHHPFEGKKMIEIRCLDRAAKVQFFGHNPIFVFSETDKANELPMIADKGTIDEADYSYVHKFWAACPTELHTLFKHAFGDGVKNITQRKPETAWIKVFSTLYDKIISCASCGVENFLTESMKCWKCSNVYPKPILLKVKNANNNVTAAEIAITAGKQLSSRHFKKDGDKLFGVIAQHPKDPKMFGLRNDSGGEWTFVNGKGETVAVPVDRNVPVNQNNKIDFGNGYVGVFEG